MLKKIIVIFSMLILFSGSVFAKYKKSTNEGNGFKNEYIKVSILSINRLKNNNKESKVIMVLKIDNVYSKHIGVNFLNRLTLTGNDGIVGSTGSYHDTENVAGITLKSNPTYGTTTIRKDASTVVTITFRFKEKSNANQYHLTSNMTVDTDITDKKGNKESLHTFSAGIYSIKLE